MSPRTKQVILTVVATGSAVAISVLTGSAWHWAPFALALLVNLRSVLGLPAATPNAAADAVAKVVK
jgi:hypothetical protein